MIINILPENCALMKHKPLRTYRMINLFYIVQSIVIKVIFENLALVFQEFLAILTTSNMAGGQQTHFNFEGALGIRTLY